MVLWNFDLLRKNYGIMGETTLTLWTKLWYYGQTCGTIPSTKELRFTKEKKLVNYQKQ